MQLFLDLCGAARLLPQLHGCWTRWRHALIRWSLAVNCWERSYIMISERLLILRAVWRASLVLPLYACPINVFSINSWTAVVPCRWSCSAFRDWHYMPLWSPKKGRLDVTLAKCWQLCSSRNSSLGSLYTVLVLVLMSSQQDVSYFAEAAGRLVCK